MMNLKGISLPFTFIVILIFLLILFIIILIWNITGFNLADVLFKNYTSDIPSNLSGGAV